MHTDRDTTRIVRSWLEEGRTALPDHILDAVLDQVPATPQRRSWWPAWRFVDMNTYAKLAIGVAAVAVVAVVGINLLAGTGGGVGGSSTVSPSPSLGGAPTAAPTVPPGITEWTMYTSAVHRFTVGYPADWSVNAPATREWRPGDRIDVDAWPYADTFIGPGDGDDTIGLFLWEMPAGDGVDVDSVDDLKAWAQRFCSDVGASSCDQFTQRAVPMCHNVGGDSCRAAILVPTDEEQYAFFGDWLSMMFTNSPDRITVVVIGREDDFPSAARYGGSVELLKSILTTMDVWTPGQEQYPEEWIRDVEPPS